MATHDILEMETPCVLIDLDRAEDNIRSAQQSLTKAGLAVRPHIKTHKLPRLAKLQIAAGAVGITCQKLGEAEVMADAGISDIFLPYNLIGNAKLSRAVALARRTRLSLTCDIAAVARGLSEAFAQAGLTVEMLVECETGLERCGVRTPVEAVELACLIDALPGLCFGGLMTYPPPGRIAAVDLSLDTARKALAKAGLSCSRISTGGTPDLRQAASYSCATEYRPGTYVYNDRSLIAHGSCGIEDCALTVLATVVSTPAPGRCIIDAGSKALTSDLLGMAGYGQVLGYPEVIVCELSEEHGHLTFAPGAKSPGLGERVQIIPNHACVVSNLFDAVHLVRDGRVEAVERVAARGRVM